MEKIIIKGFPLDTKVDGIMLLESFTQGMTKQNTSFLTLRLSDGNEIVEAKLWDTSKENFEIPAESLIAVTLFAKTYNDTKSFEVTKYCKVPDDSMFSITDFVRKAPYRPEEMYNYILKVVNSTAECTPVTNIVNYIYEKNKEKLLYWSAAEKIHHNLYGGLLYHTFRMIQSAQCLSKVYSAVSKELLYGAVAVHDIGKLAELETTQLGNAEYTVQGSLFGHTAIGMMMIDRARIELGITEEAVTDLLHCIAAHHGKMEWGAASKPATLEAYLLHMIDNIDAKVYQFEEIYDSTEAGKLSDRVFTLDNVKVYRSDIYHPAE